jgi:hypothetical protein
MKDQYKLAKVLDVYEYTALVEFEDDNGYIQRKYISRELLPSSKKEPTLIGITFLNTGIEYSDVDLVAALGDNIENIQTIQLQDALRRAGVWRRMDYENKPKIVSKVVREVRHPSKLPDVTTILNAAHFMRSDGG